MLAVMILTSFASNILVQSEPKSHGLCTAFEPQLNKGEVGLPTATADMGQHMCGAVRNLDLRGVHATVAGHGASKVQC